ncbi:MAG: TIGR02186 family protein, partial [Deltaproteobacteria bacterium]
MRLTATFILAGSILAGAVVAIAYLGPAAAQVAAKSKQKAVVGPPAAAEAQLSAERVEADVSTRTIAVTSGYSGSEILVFGTIENSRQPSAESGFYDVAVIVEGAPEPLMVRKKGRVGGLWVNTSTFNFNSVPSYYAVASTRPLEEFASPALLDDNGIGLDAVRMAPAADSAVRVSSEDLIAFKDAVRRLKESAQLFKRDDYGV